MTTQEVRRKLVAILSADVKGYSRLMGADEEGTLRTLTAYREAMAQLILGHRGRVVNAPGDALLAEFESVVDAVKSAVEIQRELAKKNAELTADHRMEYRMGINLGDVMVDGEAIYGDGINIAARLESLSESGGICISGTAYDQVKNKVPLGYEYLGEQIVKNIAEPVRTYRVLMGSEAVGKVIGEKKVIPRQLPRAAIGVVVVLIVVAAIAIWRLYIPPAPQTEVAPKEKSTVPLPEKPSATVPPSVEVAPKEKVALPSPEKVAKPTPLPLKVEVASKKRMAFPLPDKPSIAVLPFVNMSGDPKKDYLSDGIAEEIINALSKIPHVFVIARNSTFTYKGKSVKVQQVAEEMGVQYVLEGSVQWSGDRVRITAQLIDAIKGHHLFSERYDRELKDIFAMQDDIAIKITTAMRVQLTDGEFARAFAKGTKNLDAYLKALQSHEKRQLFTKESQAQARQLAEEAIALDTGYAMAYCHLANAIGNEVMMGVYKDPGEALARAMDLAQKAITIDDSLAQAHVTLGFISIMYKKDFDKGLAEVERAVALEPNSADIVAMLAIFFTWAGHPEEAIPIFKKAMRLSPIPQPRWLFNMANAYRMMGQYEETISICKRIIQKQPDQLYGHIHLAAAYMDAGREEEARAEAAEILRIDPKFSLENFAKATPRKDQAELSRMVELLRKAGLK